VRSQNGHAPSRIGSGGSISSAIGCPRARGERSSPSSERPGTSLNPWVPPTEHATRPSGRRASA